MFSIPLRSAGYPKTRWALSATALLLVGAELFYLVSVAYPVYVEVTNRTLDLGDLDYDGVTKFAVDVRIDQAKSTFTYIVVMLGAIWSLLLVKTDAPGIAGKDWQEIVMFGAANIAILVHVLLYGYYMWLVSALTAAASRGRNVGEASSIPDIFDARINIFAVSQQYSAVIIVLIVGLLIVSVHKLKGANK